MRTLVCAKCGQQFQHKRWNVKYCDDCNAMRVFDRLAATHMYRARKLGLTEHVTASELFDVYREQGAICQRCGQSESDASIVFDHVVALGFGGTNTADNLQLLCHRCNVIKCRDPIDYR